MIAIFCKLLFLVSDAQLFCLCFCFSNTDLVKRCIERKKDSGASKKTAKHCKVLLVVDCILKFLSLPLKVIAAKRYTACEYSQLVSEYILSQFTIIGRNGR